MPKPDPGQRAFQVELRCWTHKADVMHTFALLDYPCQRGDEWRASICRRWWERFGPKTPLLDGDEMKVGRS